MLRSPRRDVVDDERGSVDVHDVLDADGSIGYARGCVARIPQVQLDLRFPDRTSLEGLRPSSGAWSTLHADYMFGWDAARFSGLVEGCLNVHVVCTSTVTG